MDDEIELLDGASAEFDMELVTKGEPVSYTHLDVYKRQTEDTGATSKDGVYAGGDAVTGAATVILAMGAGKAAAKGLSLIHI